MTDHINLDLVDTDGAIREAEEAVAGDSRADFFRKAALTGGAVLGSGVVLGGFPEFSFAAKPSKKNDVAILNFALTLEYLESAFYKEALAKAGLTGDNLNVTKIVSAHENTHVKTLKKALGKAAVKEPKFNFGATTANQTNFLKTAVTLEDTGVKAYSGQATNIKQSAVVKAAVSILTVEARHASRFRALNGQNFAPAAFDKAATKGQILAAVKKTKFIKS
jgi:rubrerythrin